MTFVVILAAWAMASTATAGIWCAVFKLGHIHDLLALDACACDSCDVDDCSECLGGPDCFMCAAEDEFDVDLADLDAPGPDQLKVHGVRTREMFAPLDAVERGQLCDLPPRIRARAVFAEWVFRCVEIDGCPPGVITQARAVVSIAKQFGLDHPFMQTTGLTDKPRHVSASADYQVRT